MGSRLRGLRRAKRSQPESAGGRTRRQESEPVVRSESYYASLAKSLAELNSCSVADIMERANMVGLESEAIRTYGAISEGICPHCHGGSDKRAAEADSYKRKSDKAFKSIEGWFNLPSVEFAQQLKKRS